VLLLGFNVLDPIVNFMSTTLHWLTGYTHNFGWSLIILAVGIKALFWQLNVMQYTSMTKMQLTQSKLKPRLEQLKSKYKDDPQKLNTETMALYKELGVNPLSGCLPMLLPMPVFFSIWYAINANKPVFANTTWAWIGSPISAKFPLLFASSLAQTDHVLLLLYAASMYFSVRISSPALDPQQAQQQKIMSVISPLMIGYIGLRYAWPSAFLLYWLSYNVLQMAQQLFMVRTLRPKLEAEAAAAIAAPRVVKPVTPQAALADGTVDPPKKSGATRSSGRPRKSSRR